MSVLVARVRNSLGVGLGVSASVQGTDRELQGTALYLEMLKVLGAPGR